MKRQRSDDVACGNDLSKKTYEIKDLVEDVRCCANTVAQELKASYDASVYYDALELTLCEKFKGCGMVVKRGLTIPIGIFGHKHVLGNIKIPLAICDAADDMRPVILLEIKSKKAQLKEADLETMRCCVEQITNMCAKATPFIIPTCMVIKMLGGHVEALIIDDTGQVEEIF